MSRVDDLLAGPRGRSLCEALASAPHGVFEALDHAVAFAVYWQAPMDGDSPADELRPWAEYLLRSPEIGWWRAPAQLDDQWVTSYDDPPVLDPAPELRRWAQEQRDAVHDPDDRLREDVSGTWWSTPNRLRGSTRSLPDRGPVGLWLVEDSLGWTRATCWPVAPTREPRVFEVHGPDDWALLARTYPFDVTDSRAPDWRRATGRVGRWVIPDWPAVATDYDAVHVSTWGWLMTAGRPVPVNGAASLLAGWSPDATYWLTDCLAVTGPPVGYQRDGQDWRAVSVPGAAGS